jgi:hypothetical protein
MNEHALPQWATLDTWCGYEVAGMILSRTLHGAMGFDRKTRLCMFHLTPVTISKQ